ncbi:MAG: phosphatase PAP2 family protein [Ruminococcus sp.]|nr:phosphatase PAP2 family protein [Ruminococcus sp.]
MMNLSSITDWDLSVLRTIAEIRNDALTVFFKIITFIGDYGIFWIAVCFTLLLIPKTKRIGIYATCSLSLQLILGVVILKNIFDRDRPFIVDPTIDTIIKHPSDASFPSGHSSSSAATALSVFFQNKKLGTPLLILAVLIMFSRLYFEVHYLTDVIGGAVLGTAVAIFVYFALNRLEERHKIKNSNPESETGTETE